MESRFFSDFTGIVKKSFFTLIKSANVWDAPTLPLLTRKIFSSPNTFRTLKVSLPIPIEVPDPITDESDET